MQAQNAYEMMIKRCATFIKQAPKSIGQEYVNDLNELTDEQLQELINTNLDCLSLSNDSERQEIQTRLTKILEYLEYRIRGILVLVNDNTIMAIDKQWKLLERVLDLLKQFRDNFIPTESNRDLTVLSRLTDRTVLSRTDVYLRILYDFCFIQDRSLGNFVRQNKKCLSKVDLANQLEIWSKGFPEKLSQLGNGDYDAGLFIQLKTEVEIERNNLNILRQLVALTTLSNEQERIKEIDKNWNQCKDDFGKLYTGETWVRIFIAKSEDPRLSFDRRNQFLRSARECLSKIPKNHPRFKELERLLITADNNLTRELQPKLPLFFRIYDSIH